MSINVFASRGDQKTLKHDGELNPLMIDLLIALLVLTLVGIAASGALVFLRRMRRAQKLRNASELPMYHPNAPQEGLNSRRGSHQRHLSITTTPAGFGHEQYAQRHGSVYFYDEKKAMCGSVDSSPPTSPLPEIRITFPEEVDDTGRTQSGRVVVVRVGDTTVGMEPYEDLPPYEQREGEGGFHTLDLEKMGGLKEKEIVVTEEKRWS